jgi:hypothetical protein
VRNGIAGVAGGFHQLLDLVEHGIHALAQPVELIPGSAHGHAPAKLAAHDHFSGPRQFIRSPRRPAGNQQAAQQ